MAATTVVGSELIATLVNVQWYLCILSLLLIVAAPGGLTRRRQEIWLTIVQASIALSAPVTILYIPFLIWRVKNNAGWFRLRPAIHLAALFLQAWIMRQGLSEGRPVLRFNTLFLATLASGLSRCVLGPLTGSSFLLKDNDASLFTRLSIALILGVTLATLLVLKLSRAPQMKWLLGAAYVGVGSLVASLWGRGVLKIFLSVEGLRTYTAERYFFVGACMFIFCLALAIDTFNRGASPMISAALLGGVFAWGTIQNFPAKAFKDMSWKDSAAKIENWETARRQHLRIDALKIPLNPPDLVLLLN